MTNSAILLAAGYGQRFGGEIPKQFSEINGFPLIWYSINVFNQFDPSINIILVLDVEQKSNWEDICLKKNIDIPHKIIAGGNSRSESVKKALQEIEDDGRVYIHDVARPCLNTELLQRIQEGMKKYGNSIPVIPEHNTLRIRNNNLYSSFNRENVVVVQTPQAFLISDIKMAYNRFFSTTALDDAEIAEKSGLIIHHVDGDFTNIKVTYPFDLEIANVILSKRKK